MSLAPHDHVVTIWTVGDDDIGHKIRVTRAHDSEWTRVETGHVTYTVYGSGLADRAPGDVTRDAGDGKRKVGTFERVVVVSDYDTVPDHVRESVPGGEP